MDMETVHMLLNFLPAAALTVSCIILYDKAGSDSMTYVFSYFIGSFGFISFTSLHGMFQVYHSMRWDPYVILNWGVLSTAVWIYSQVCLLQLKKKKEPGKVSEFMEQLWTKGFYFSCTASAAALCSYPLWH